MASPHLGTVHTGSLHHPAAEYWVSISSNTEEIERNIWNGNTEGRKTFMEPVAPPTSLYWYWYVSRYGIFTQITHKIFKVINKAKTSVSVMYYMIKIQESFIHFSCVRIHKNWNAVPPSPQQGGLWEIFPLLFLLINAVSSSLKSFLKII